MEKRGPVEFNHAISYVNKIKVRLRIVLTLCDPLCLGFSHCDGSGAWDGRPYQSQTLTCY